MCVIIHWVIVEIQTEWVPSLADFWVNVGRAVVVSVDFGQDVIGDEIGVGLQSVMEDDLEVGVEREVVLVVIWRGSAVQ